VANASGSNDSRRLEILAVGEALAELGRARLELGVGELLQRILQTVDVVHQRLELLHLALVLRAEKLLDDSAEHLGLENVGKGTAPAGPLSMRAGGFRAQQQGTSSTRRSDRPVAW
jgi:hypothetical protein